MPEITDAQWNLFTDGQASDAEDVSDNIYNPSGAASSLEHINGHLEKVNLPAATDSTFWEIPTEVVQKNTFTGGSMVASTGNLDFFREPHFADSFRENVYGPDLAVDGDAIQYLREWSDGSESMVDTTVEFAQDEDFIPIPGASISFYLPYDCTLVMLTWNIQFEDDGDNGNTMEPTLVVGEQGSRTTKTRTWLRLYLDNAWVEGQERITFPHMTKPRASGSDYYLPSSTFYGPRYWNGHHAAYTGDGTGLNKGWHSASIRIYSNSNQARVRVRGIRHVYFR